jgi:LPS export ABC transporter protein LptC
MIKTLKTFIKSIFLLLLGVMLFSCENDINVINSLKIDEGKAVESTYNVEMTITDSGRVVMLMKSPQIDKYFVNREYMEMPKGIHIIFYDSIGGIRSTLDADYAISYSGSKIMEAKNNVVAVNNEGKTLYTEELIWDQRKHRIYTENEVKIVTEKEILFGDGLTADENFSNWQISHPRGDIQVDDFDSETETNDSEIK